MTRDNFETDIINPDYAEIDVGGDEEFDPYIDRQARAKARRVVLSGLGCFWIVVVTIALIMLSGCGPGQNMGADGYVFDEAEWEALEFKVVMVPYSSATEFRRAARVHKAVVEGGETHAFAQMVKGVSCRIHYLDPKVRYEPEWLGHELAHCAYGRWHNPKRSGAPL